MSLSTRGMLDMYLLSRVYRRLQNLLRVSFRFVYFIPLAVQDSRYAPFYQTLPRS
jgi:hypothetical protein